MTKEEVMIRSDVQNYPNDKDYNYLKRRGITTIIDMHGQKDVERKTSGFAGKEGFEYFNFQIDEGSGVPETMETVPKSYMSISSANAMQEVFKYIAFAKSGVMFMEEFLRLFREKYGDTEKYFESLGLSAREIWSDAS